MLGKIIRWTLGGILMGMLAVALRFWIAVDMSRQARIATQRPAPH